MYQKNYIEIAYDQFQLILKMIDSLFLKTFVTVFFYCHLTFKDLVK